MKVKIPNFNQLNLTQQKDGLCVGCTHFVDKDDWSTEYICNNFGCKKISCFKCDGFNPDEYNKGTESWWIELWMNIQRKRDKNS